MMKLKRPLRKLQAAFFITALILLLSACRTTAVRDTEAAVLVSKETVHPAITVETYRDKAYPLIYHLVTIDLQDETLTLTADPLPATDDEPGCVSGETTLDFAKRTNAIVAVNATPFAIPDGKPRHATRNRKLSGIFIANGVQYAEPAPQYGALGFTKDRRAFVLEAQDMPLPDDAAFVFGGFWVILKDGEHFDSFKSFQDSRTTAGISSDGKTLFLLIVEGEQPLSSRGLSYFDCAELLLSRGASDAIELDGGSSTSLVIQGKNRLSYPEITIVSNSFGFVSTGSVY